MNFEQNTGDSLDLGFDVPEAGTYIYQIGEGIELKKKDNGKRAINIPVEIVDTLQGNAENLHKKAVMFINVRDENGKVYNSTGKQLGTLLSFTGVIAEFQKKFGESVEPDDEKFIAGLKIKLRGKLLKLTHNIRTYKDDSGQDRQSVNFTKIERATKGAPGSAPAPSGAVSSEATSAPADDWS